MFIVLLWLLVGALVGLFIGITSEKEYTDYSDYPMITKRRSPTTSEKVGDVVFFSIVGFILGVLLSFGVAFFNDPIINGPYRENLVSLSDGGRINGGIFVIREDSAFIFYVEDEHGNIRQQDINVDDPGDIIIREDGSEHPYVEYREHDQFHVYPWSVQIGQYNYRDYIFHIPEGSVVNDFTLDGDD